MSIRVSKRGHSAGLAITAAVTAYLLFSSGFTYLAERVEATGYVYPYFEEGEDVLRFLLPSLVGGSGRGRIMLTGPSVAGEALLYEEFNRAFPDHRAYNASFPVATLDDVLIALDYIERVYGANALPDVLILGVEARLLAIKPRLFGPYEDDRSLYGDAYLIDAINRFSPHFRVGKTDNGSILTPKTGRERLAAWWGFWTRKQQPRHRAAIAAALGRIVNGPGPHLDLVTSLPLMENIRDPFAPSTALPAFRYMAAVGPYTALRRWIPALVSPYHTHYGPQVPPELDLEYGMGIRHWDPSPDEELIKSQVGRLKATAARLRMKLLLVNIPQRPASRLVHQQRYYDALMAFVRGALGDTPFLDLRTLLPDEDFTNEHVAHSGAQRVTAEVIAFIRSQGGLPSVTRPTD